LISGPLGFMMNSENNVGKRDDVYGMGDHPSHLTPVTAEAT